MSILDRTASMRQPADAEIVFKQGNLFLHNLDVTQEVQPGGTVTIDFTISNGALAVPGTDPDCCGPSCGLPGGNALNGFQYEVQAAAVWGGPGQTSQECIGTTEFGTVDIDHSFSFTAPSDPVESSVGVNLVLLGSGVSESVEIPVVVGGGNGDDGGGDDGRTGLPWEEGPGSGDGDDGGNGDQPPAGGVSRDELLVGGLVLAAGGAYVLTRGSGSGNGSRNRR